MYIVVYFIYKKNGSLVFPSNPNFGFVMLNYPILSSQLDSTTVHFTFVSFFCLKFGRVQESQHPGHRKLCHSQEEWPQNWDGHH